MFYTIFQALEMKLEESKDSLIGEFLIPDVMNRTEAFEKDLRFHFGPDWKNYQIKPEGKQRKISSGCILPGFCFL